MAYLSLHERLKGPIAQALRDELGITNTNALPRVHKVVVNVGINKSKMDSKEVREYVTKCLGTITGQRPVFTKAKKAISNFKTRQGMIVGASVTLRGRQMEEFLDRLVSYSLPRVRDFRGLSAKLDGQGNYSIGLRDHSIFPEIPPVEAKDIFGMQITIATTARNDAHAHALLKNIGMPFKQEKKEGSSIESKGKSPDTPHSPLPTPEPEPEPEPESQS
ncbi:50S ribosomal protein L5 [Candidatus Peribacteria bacterium]|nr:50S ribosomal protein L5 [Candidatus Peribacteria bacterium]